MKRKRFIFKFLKDNMLISSFQKRRNFCKKFFVFKMLKCFCENKITKNFKKVGTNNRVEQFKIKIVKRKLKKLMINWFDYKKRINYKIRHFRNTMLKIKFFKFLKENKNITQFNDNKKVMKFKTSFLKYNFFVMLYKFRLIQYRENRIVNKLKKIYKQKRKKLIKKYVESWKKYYICEKFRKVKQLRKITKIFLALKFNYFNNKIK